MLLPPIKQLPKDNPAKAVCDANDAEEKAALGLAHAPKLYRTVSGEGVEGANADVVEDVTEKVEQHGGRRENGGVHLQQGLLGLLGNI